MPTQPGGQGTEVVEQGPVELPGIEDVEETTMTLAQSCGSGSVTAPLYQSARPDAMLRRDPRDITLAGIELKGHEPDGHESWTMNRNILSAHARWPRPPTALPRHLRTPHSVHRGTIFVEDCEILAHEAHPAGQWRLRLHAPRIAAKAEPGSFVHLRCDPLLPMRRPMSLMRADPDGGWVDLLYKEVGHGTRQLAGQPPGTHLSVIGPIGRPFEAVAGRARALLIGGGVGIPPMVFLADRLRRDPSVSTFVAMGSEVPFPFETPASDIPVPGVDGGATATMPLLERWGIAARLASGAGLPGCHHGHVTDLAKTWLDALDKDARAEVAVYACGPVPMLEASVDLARAHALPCLVSLEEYMACAVGGCAGCTVRVRTAGGRAMKRVCVDGPVFDGHTVVFDPSTPKPAELC